MKKDNFPSFVEWTYTKWYFWVFVVLWSAWSGYEALIKIDIFLFLGNVIFVIIFLSLLFFFSYIMSKFNCKKLNHI